MDVIYERIEKSFNKQGFLALLGVKIESIEKGKVVFSCESREDLTQHTGFMHAGVVSTVADVTCGYTALSVMPEGKEVMGVEFKVNFLRPAAGKKIISTGKVINAGKTLVVTEAEVTDAETGKVIAKMQGTMMAV